MKVTADPDRGQGHAPCWDICPEVFSLDEEGHAVVAAGEVPAALEAKANRAVANCPERALTSPSPTASRRIDMPGMPGLTSMRCRTKSWEWKASTPTVHATASRPHAGGSHLMVGSFAFGPVRKSGDHTAAADRVNEPSAGEQASRPRRAAGLLRPSQVPVRSSGQPLAAPVKQEMEARLGADFSQVLVHTGGAARASAARFGARAYTVGSHVVIGDGGADKHVLAHELTHVIQQRTGPVAGTDYGGGLKVSDPSDRDERAAEANAVRVMGAPPMRRVAKSSADTNQTPGVPVVQRVADYTGPTIGVEQEFKSRQKIVTTDPNIRKGPIGVVRKGTEELVEFTADIGGAFNEYTIELKTTPTVKNNGTGTGLPQGILDRQAAMKVMVGAIQRANAYEGPVLPGSYGEYTIDIKKSNHRILLAKKEYDPEKKPSGAPVDEPVRFGNQASVGVKRSDLGIGGNSAEVDLILNQAGWFNRNLENDLNPQGLINAAQSKTVYALVASVIAFLHSTVEGSHLVKVEGDDIVGDLYSSSIKDRWGVLPRTPVWDWIEPLAPTDQSAVKGKLSSTYDKSPTKAAFKHIANRLSLAGHAVPESTIGGTPASVFEFRSVPDDLLPYLYEASDKEWELPPELAEHERLKYEEHLRNRKSSRGIEKLIEKSRKQEQGKPSKEEEEADSEWD